MLVTLDVRNDFNSARWDVILHALENRFNTPLYLLRMVRNYLCDRILNYDTADGPRMKKITAGAAQGSILGPDLWNISYDGILHMELPQDVYLVGYADDIAAVIVARDVIDAQRTLNQVMRRVLAWMSEHSLRLATEKTEIVLLTRRRIPNGIEMRVNSDVILTKNAVKYLGLQLDKKMTFWEQIRSACDKAAKVTSHLSGLMANVGGPTSSKRRLLMSVIQSILLYGCEVWAEALNRAKYRKRMVGVQRIGALRIVSSYRTVSEPAVLVIAGVMPTDLLVQERKIIYERRKEVDKRAVKEDAKASIRYIWQERWENETRGRWTARLIPNITDWIDRDHGEINYYLTQFLTGHGYFNKYLAKMGKVESPACPYQDSTEDDAYHTFFMCKRWNEDREELEQEVGLLTPDNVIDMMLSRNDYWHKIAVFVEKVLKNKKSETG